MKFATLSNTFSALRGLAAAGLLCTVAMQAAPARAQSSCENDFSAINKKLEGQVAALNALTKGKRKQVDPGAACPRLRNLSATERELLAYMKKNQSWCSIPEEVISKFTERAANTSRVAGQACKAAAMQAKMRKQAAQQSRGGGAPDPRPRMPTGPL